MQARSAPLAARSSGRPAIHATASVWSGCTAKSSAPASAPAPPHEGPSEDEDQEAGHCVEEKVSHKMDHGRRAEEPKWPEKGEDGQRPVERGIGALRPPVVVPREPGEPILRVTERPIVLKQRGIVSEIGPAQSIQVGPGRNEHDGEAEKPGRSPPRPW